MPAYLIWFLVGVAFLLTELAMPGFILAFFCLGSWCAALASLATDTLSIQLLVFIVASLSSLFFLRKVFIRTFGGAAKEDVDVGLKDSKIGKTATVTKEIAPHKPGEIKFGGSFWRAEADLEIAPDTPVVIQAVASDDGLTYKVQPLDGGRDG